MSMNNNTFYYAGRLRSRSKQPVYTSDKRAKFTQRENKKWIRFGTVVGYIFFVSLPAVALSIYYVHIWDPGYIQRVPPPGDQINASKPPYPDLSPKPRVRRGNDSSLPTPLEKLHPHTLPTDSSESSCNCQCPSPPKVPDLNLLLSHGKRTSAEEEMPLDLEGKSIVLVTGATGPLGKAFAHKFAEALSQESCLVLSSRSRSRLGDLKDELEHAGAKCHIGLLEWDLKNPSSKQFKSDLEEVTHSAISYAGMQIRLKSSKYTNAIVVHNAATIGNMQHDMLEVGRHEKDLMESFAVNVVAPAAITSSFFEVFNNASKKIVVNMTAPSADNAYPSFGYTSMAKSSRKMGFDVLTKEHPEIKVLHFNPVAVDSPSLRHIRDHSHDKEVRDTFKSIYDEQKTYSAEHVADALVGILGQVDFESGEVIGANEVQVA